MSLSRILFSLLFAASCLTTLSASPSTNGPAPEAIAQMNNLAVEQAMASPTQPPVLPNGQIAIPNAPLPEVMGALHRRNAARGNQPGRDPGGEPPDLIVDPQAIESELNTGDWEEHVIALDNDGDAALEFSVDIETISEPERDAGERGLRRVDVGAGPRRDDIDLGDHRIAVFQANGNWGWLYDAFVSGRDPLLNRDNVINYRNPDDWNAVDFEEFSVVVVDGYNQPYVNQYRNNLERFEGWVADGGGAYFEMANSQNQIMSPGGIWNNVGNGSNNGILVVSPEPGDENYSLFAEICHETQPNFWNEGEVIEGNSHYHGGYDLAQFNERLDNGTIEWYQVIAVHEQNRNITGTIAYGFGKGTVMDVSHPVGHTWYNWVQEGQWGSIASEIFYYLIEASGTGWVSVMPEEGIIEAGDNLNATLTLNAEGLAEGDYVADVHFLSDDEDSPDVVVSVNLTVNGAADINVVWDEENGYPNMVDWNTVHADLFTGHPFDMTVVVVNEGVQQLNVDRVVIDNGYFTTGAGRFGLAPGDEREVVITLNADESGQHEATMTLVSNDPNPAEYQVRLFGETGTPPVITIDPGMIEDRLFTGGTNEHVLSVVNDGEAPLRFELAVDVISQPQRDENGRALRGVDGEAAGPQRDQLGQTLAQFRWPQIGQNQYKSGIAWDKENELMLLTSYSPNWMCIVDPAQEYRVLRQWQPNMNPMGATWLDGIYYVIGWANNQLYTFDAEGNATGNFNVNMQITSVTASPELNVILGGDNNGNRDIHVYNPEGQRLATIGRANYGQYMGNQWQRSLCWVDKHSDGQLWINSPGRVWEVSVDTENWEATGAVQNFANGGSEEWDGIGHDGHNLWIGRYNAPGYSIVDDGVQEMYWLSLDPMEGTVEGGANMDIFVGLDAFGLVEGNFEADVHFLSNDPASPDLAVNLLMTVVGAPDISVQWGEDNGFPDVLDFNMAYDELYSGGPYGIVVDVKNDGSDDLRIDNIAGDHEYFTADPANLVLEPRQTGQVTIIFNAPADNPGDYNANVEFTSNDPDEEVFQLAVHAEASLPPQMIVEPGNIEVDLFTGGLSEHVLTVANDGQAPLRFTIEQEILQEPGRDADGRSLRSVNGSAGPQRDNPGQEIGQFTWQGGEGQNQHKAGIAYDFDNDLLFVTGYDRNIFAILDPNDNYRVVRQWNNQGNGQPMDAAWLNGVFYNVQLWNNALFRWDVNGNRLDPMNLQWQVKGVAASQELGVLFILHNNDQSRIEVINPENGQQVGVINNYRQYEDNREAFSILWVDKHENGQLWLNGWDAGAYQIAVNTDNWQATGRTQQWQFPNPINRQPWTGIGFDGHNLIIGDYGHAGYQIVDDGIVELYWLGYEPTEGEVEGGSSTDVFVTLDAAGLIGGDYEADLHFLSNDPANADLAVNVMMHVTGAPSLVAEWPEEYGYPDVIDWDSAYPDFFTGNPYDMTVNLSNQGTERLTIDNISVDHEFFSVAPVQFTLEPGRNRDIVITFEAPADAPDEYLQTLTVNSDDPDQPDFEIPLRADVQLPPAIVIEPNGIEEELFTGGIAEHTLSVGNDGDAPLRFTVEHVILDEPRDASGRELRNVNGSAGPQRDNPGQQLGQFSWQGGEGQNQYKAGIAYDFDNEMLFVTGYDRNIFAILDPTDNYRVVRQWNNQGNGNPMDAAWLDGTFYDVQLWNNALFRWDINGNRMDPLNLQFQVRAVAASQDMGVLFCLNNQNINEIVIVNPDNGQQIGVINNWRGYADNRDVYNILWVDKHEGGQLWVHGWDAWIYQITVNTDNWQATQRAQNAFQFPNRQNAQPWDGLGFDGHNLILGQYGAANYQIVDDGITELYWLAYEPTEGTVESGNSADVFVTLDATDLQEGDYEADLVFFSNDPDRARLAANVYMHVTGASDLAVEWPDEYGYPEVLDWNMAFADLYSGGPYSIVVTVSNGGTAALNVDDIGFDHEFFSADPVAFALDPDQTQDVTVTFNAPANAPNDYNQVMTFFSDDPDEAEFAVALHANASLPPIIVVEPNAIEDDLFTDQTNEHVITVGNDGDAELNFTIEHIIISEPERDVNARTLRSVDGAAGAQRDNPGDILAQFQTRYNTYGGMAWDGELMWGSSYGNQKLISVDPENHQIVNDFQINGNPIAMAFDGENLWTTQWSSNQIYVWDRGGNRVDQFNMNFGQIAGLASDGEETIFIMSLDDRNIHRINKDNHQEMGRFNAQNAFGNSDVWGIEWVAAHPEGELWGMRDGGLAFQVDVDENWNCQQVQQIQTRSQYRHCEMAHDGYDMWYGRWDDATWYIMDDGVAETYWLAYDPKEGTLAGGDSEDIFVTLDATGLIGGDYEADLHFLSNDPANPDMVTSIFLHVTGAASLQVTWDDVAGYPEEIDWNAVFDDLFTGVANSIEVTVANEGTAVLEVAEIVCDNGAFTADPAAFDVAPGEETVINFTLNSENEGVQEGTMVISSNDPDGDFEIFVRGETLSPPQIVLDGGNIEDEIFTGGMMEHVYTVSNDGGAPLRYTMDHLILAQPQRDDQERELRGVDGAAGPQRDARGDVLAQFQWNRSPQWNYKAGIAWDWDNELMLLTSYGSNWMALVDPANNYRTVREWQPQNNQPMGATWLDGTFYTVRWTGGEQRLFMYDMEGNLTGFFNTNGIVPTSVTASQAEEVLIVGDGNNNRDIFVYALNGQRIAQIDRGNYQQFMGGQWQRSLCWVDQHTEGQLWMNGGGRAWQVSVDTENWRCTGAVANFNTGADQEWDGIGFDGHNLWVGRYNSPSYFIFDDGIAESYWLLYDPAEGEVAGGQSMDVFVTIDGTGLVGGDYEADLTWYSNDPDDPEVTVNVLVHVTEAADIMVEWSDDFGFPGALDWNAAHEDFYSGGPYEMTVIVKNGGTGDLAVSDIMADHEYFTAAPTEFNLAPRATRAVVVTFEAPADQPGEYNQNLTFFSDDPDEQEMSISLHADAALPPVIVVDPNGIEEDLFTGGTAEPVLTVVNEGQADLRFTVEHEIISEPGRDENGRSLRGVDGRNVGPQRDNPGQEIGQFTWQGGEGQNQHKAGIAYDFDNDLLFVTGYDRNIFAILDPSDNYSVVRQWNNPGNGNPMDAAWLDGVFYDVQLWNNALFRWDVNGNRLDPLNLQWQVRGVAASQELGCLFILHNNDINRLEVVNPQNGQGFAAINNYRQFADNRDIYSILWVDKHEGGQLWLNGWDAGAYQIGVNTDNWQATGRVQQFQFPNPQNRQPWTGIGFDGHNLIVGDYGHATYQIVDDGITELYWLAYEPTEGTIAGGDAMDVFVTLDASGLIEGGYEADIHFLSNDPANPDLVVAVVLNVTGAPNLSVEWNDDFGFPEVLDWNMAYDDFYSGGPYDMTVKITNEGTAELVVDGIGFDHEFFSVDPDQFVLDVDGSQDVTVTFNAPADQPGEYNQTMTIVSNDPDQAEFPVALHANATLPPTIVVEPNSLEEELVTGEIVQHDFTVTNEGAALLRFEVEHEIISEPERDQNSRTLRNVDGGANPNRDDAGTILRRVNVPTNTFGGMAFDGELVWGSSYGNSRLISVDPETDQVVNNFGINGGPMSLAWDGQQFWTTQWAGNMIYMYDQAGNRTGEFGLNFGAFGGMASDLERGFVLINCINDRRIHVIRIDNHQEVASFDARQAWQGQDVYGIEWVEAHKDGQLWGQSPGRLWQMSVDDNWNTQLIQSFAIESDVPHTEMCNDGENMWHGGRWGDQQWRVYDDGVAEMRWLAYDPKEGALDGGNWMDIAVTLDATGLLGGDYEADLHFLSNDPANPDLAVNILLHVTAAPTIVVEWPAAAGFPVMNWNRVYPTLYSGGPYTIPVTIKNEGTDLLIVEDIVCNNAYFSADPTNFEVEIGEETVIDFIVNADEDGLHEGVMTIFSNDLRMEEYEVLVRARSAAPPAIVVAPNAIEEELFTGGHSDHVVTIGNEGAARLRWSTEMEIISEPERDRGSRSLRSVNGRAGPLRDDIDLGDARIAVFQDNGNWGWLYDAFVSGRDPLLNQNNVTNYRNSNDWNNVNFDDFSVIVTSTYGQNFVQQFENNRARFEEWVANGGGAYFETGDAHDQMRSPGGIWNNWGANSSNGVLVVSPNPNDDDYSLFAEICHSTQPNFWNRGEVIEGNSHYHSGYQLQQFVDGMNNGDIEWYQVIGVHQQNQQIPGCVAYGFGKGTVMTVGHPVGHTWYNWVQEGQWGSIASEIFFYLMEAGGSQWITYEPSEGEVSVGAEDQLVISLNAEGQNEGDYEAELHVLSNDPASSDVTVNILLHVTGAGDVTVEWSEDYGFPERLDWNAAYEDLYSGGPYEMTIEVANDGTADLVIDGIASDHEFFSANPDQFVLGPDESQDVVVTFDAPADEPGDYNQTLIIVTDDPDENEVEVALHANASLPPVIVVAPNAIEEDLRTGEIAEHILDVTNEGAAQLRFTVEHEIISEPERDLNSRTLRNVDGSASASRDNPGDILRRVNVGVNTFGGMGYDEENEWVWGSSYGQNRIIAVDKNNDQVVRNFAGPGGPLSMAFVNGNIWTTQWAGSQIFVYNREGQNIETFNLNFGAFGGMGTDNERGYVMINSINDRRIHVIRIDNHQEVASFDPRNAWQGADVYGIEWVDAHPDGQLWGCGNQRLWQVFVDENWNCQAVQNFAIEADVQHAEMCNDGENMWHVGRWGEQQWRVYDDGVAEVRWLTYDPKEGVLDGGEGMEILVTLDANGLNEGDYEADLHFLSNDPASPDLVTAIFLHVTGAPQMEVEWAAGAGFPNIVNWDAVYDELYTGGPYTIPVTFSNEGTAALIVEDITSDNGFFYADPASFEVAIDEEVTIDFVILAEEDGLHEGTLTVISNDPDDGELPIAVRGRTASPPIMVVSPNAIEEDHFTGGWSEHPINIANEGVARLNWEAEAEIISEPGRDSKSRQLRNVDGSAAGPQRDNLGDVLAQFQWNRAGQGQYKAGIAYDWDNQLMLLTCYSTNWMAIVDPANNYQTVREWQPQANQPMGATWIDGTFYVVRWTGGEQQLFMYDQDGNFTGNFGTNGIVPTSVTSSQDEEVLIIGDGNNNRDIFVYNLGGERIAQIDRGNYQQFMGGQWQRSLLWVDKHEGGQLWTNGGGRAWQISVDTDNWRCTAAVNNFAHGGDGDEWQGLGHDGYNIWFGRTNSPSYFIFDDGITEMYWLALDPQTGSLGQNEDQDVIVTLNAAGLVEGDYEADLHFRSNDPAHRDEVVTVILHVTAAADLTVEWSEDDGYPEVLDWNARHEDFYSGGPYDMVVTVANDGTDLLVVDGIAFDHEYFTANPDNFQVEPDEEIEVTITFDSPADAAGEFDQVMTIVSNDPDEAEFDVALHALTVLPPIMVIAPNAIEEALDSGDNMESVLGVANEGDADLRFETEIEVIAEPERDKNQRVLRSINGSAGPQRDDVDLEGHRIAVFQSNGNWGWLYDAFVSGRDQLLNQNNVTSYRNAADWNNVNFDDFSVIVVDAFNQNYVNEYNNNLGRFEEWVAAGGGAYFETGNSQNQIRSPGGIWNDNGNSSSNGILVVSPNPGDDDYSLFAEICHSTQANFWNRGERIEGSSHYHSGYNLQQFNERVDNGTIDWYQVIAVHEQNQQIPGAVAYGFGRGTVLTIGHPVGHTWYNYVQEGMWGSIASEIFYYLIEAGGARWLDVEPVSGTVESGGNLDVVVTLDAEGLFEGDYEADLHFLSNDPANRDQAVNIVLHVTGVPMMEVVWAGALGFPDMINWNAAFPSLFTGGPYRVPVTIRNEGTATLVIESIACDDGTFTSEPANLEIPHDESVVVMFVLDAEEDGLHQGTMTITSNDDDQAEFQIAVRGRTSAPPVIEIAPQQIEDNLATGEVSEHVLAMANTGAARLNWSTDVEILQEVERDAGSRDLRGVDGVAGPLRDDPGQELGTFRWENGQGQNNHKAGIAYDWDNELLFVTGYDRNIFALLDPNDNYRVVRQWNNQGNGNPMDAAWLNGVFYDVQLWNNSLFRWDINGNRLDPMNLNFQARAVAASQDLNVILCLNSNDINRIEILNPENGQQIGVINNWRQFIDNRDCYNILWVDKHEGGQLWANGWDAGAFQIGVNTDNWQAIERVQQFQFPNRQNPQPWDGMGFDGHNMIFGNYGSDHYKILDDGVEERYWLDWEPGEGELAAGAEGEVTVTLDATGLFGGDYEADLHFLSNDPANRDVVVNILVHVTGAASVVTDPIAQPFQDAPEVIEFPDTYVEGMSVITLNIENVGTEELVIEDIQFSNEAEFSTTVEVGTAIRPEEDMDFELLFHPQAIDAREGTITFFSNAENIDEGQFWFDMAGSGLTPAQIDVDPMLIRVIAQVDAEPVDRPMTIRNVGDDGAANLDFEISSEEIVEERDAVLRSLRTVNGRNASPPRDAPESNYLLIQESNPWGFDMERIFREQEQGVNYTRIRRATEIDNLDLDEFDAMWVVGNEEPNEFYNAYNDRLDVISEWVDAGGAYYMSTGTNNFGVAPRHPGGIVRQAYYAMQGETVVGPEENYLFELLGWERGTRTVGSWFTHCGYTEQMLINAENSDEYQIMIIGAGDQQQGNGLVAVANYNFGRGWCVIAGTTDGFLHNNPNAYTWGGAGPEMLYYLDALANDGISWLTIEPEDGSLARGEESEITLTFNPEGLEPDTEYQGIVMIESNDPSDPMVVVDVFLNTGNPELIHWPDVIETETNASLLITGITFEDEPAPFGWEVGVFTPGMVVAGAGIWTQEELGLAVWGDDPNTEEADGFTDGELMNLKLWDNDADVEYAGRAVVEEGDMHWAQNGFTVLSIESSRARSLDVNFTAGWNLISINVRPTDEALYAGDPGPEIRPMMAQLRINANNHHVFLMKNERGNFYAPAINDFNNIPYWNLAEGYQVKVDEEVMATWEGEPIPADADVPISESWNMIAYFPTYELNARPPNFPVIAPIRNSVVIAKNALGNFMIPSRNFSNMPPWRETQGYQINVNEAVTLNYPGEQGEAAALEVDPDLSTKGRWADKASTGSNMSVLITKIAGLKLSADDQVAAFNAAGELVGVGRVTDGQIGLAVWGDDPSTAKVDGLADREAFRLKLWNSKEEAEIGLTVTNIKLGEGLVYKTDEFTVIEATVEAALPAEFYLSQNFPNPFNAVTRLSFGVPEASKVSVRVFDVAGRTVATLVDGELKAGNHTAVWNGEGIAAGIYIVKMEAPSFSAVRKVTLVK